MVLGSTSPSAWSQNFLQISIGLAYLVHVLTEWPYALSLWGPNGIAGTGSLVPTLGHLGSLGDALFSQNVGTYAVLAMLGISAFGLVAGYALSICTVGAVISSTLLDSRLWQMSDGGDNLSYLVLIYSLLLLSPRAVVKEKSLRVWLHNIGIAAIAAQIVLLYFTTGLYKISGGMWQHGVAMYYIAQVQAFSRPGASELFSHPWLSCRSPTQVCCGSSSSQRRC